MEQGGSLDLGKAPWTNYQWVTQASCQTDSPKQTQVQCPWELLREEEEITESAWCWVQTSGRKYPPFPPFL